MDVMSLVGKNEFIELISSDLDDRSLVRLCRDILYVRGHTGILCMDGPGDGGRDIHSISPSGVKHLTQVKFHGNPDVACSSAELSELPMAMVKLGYQIGMFVSNARISPQGKREYTDNYPELSLEYVDGELLVEEVLSFTLLKAVWFDGASVAAISVSTVFPLLLRRHPDDLPVFLNRQELEEFLRLLQSHCGNHIVEVRDATSTAEPFPRYRAPEPLTKEEGALGFIQLTEIVLKGETPLAELERLATTIGETSVQCVGDRCKTVTAIVGSPYIVPLSGSQNGSKVSIERSEIALIYADGTSMLEEDFFQCGSLFWSSETDASVTEADHIRLYDSAIDCALAYEISSRTSQRQSSMSTASREITKKGWEESVFALVPQWDATWPHKSLREPDEVATWPWNGQRLCGWFHWTLLGGPVPIRNAGTTQSPFEMPEEAVELQKLKEIHDAITRIEGVRLLSPKEARHMVALIGQDPLPEVGYSTFHTGYLTSYHDELPTPVRPNAREFTASFAWRTSIDTATLRRLMDAAIEEVVSQSSHTFRMRREADVVRVDLKLSPPDLNVAPTTRILDRLHGELQAFCEKLEITSNNEIVIQSDTRDYWIKNYNVTLGTSWDLSSKVYMWTEDADGSITPIHVRPSDLELPAAEGSPPKNS